MIRRALIGVLRFLLAIPVTVLEACGPPARSGHTPPSQADGDAFQERLRKYGPPPKPPRGR